jgi:hypothetical protein
MRRRSKFFAEQEREVLFETRSQDDGWGTIEKSTFTLKGLVSMGANGLTPDIAPQVASGSVRLFFSKSSANALSPVTVGSIATVDGVVYQISKVDLRGTLPGSYPLRLEGVRK